MVSWIVSLLLLKKVTCEDMKLLIYQLPFNILLILFSIFYFLFFKKFLNFLSFAIGALTSFFLITIFFFLNHVGLEDFIYQYILFPITIGESRIKGDPGAFTKLTDNFSFNNLINQLKFIHLFIVSLLTIFYLN